MAWTLQDGGPWTYVDAVTAASGETFVVRYGPTSRDGEATWLVQAIGVDGTEREAIRYWPRPKAVSRDDLKAWLSLHVHDQGAVAEAVSRFRTARPWLLHN
jgi:hypothetical protein